MGNPTSRRTMACYRLWLDDSSRRHAPVQVYVRGRGTGSSTGNIRRRVSHGCRVRLAPRGRDGLVRRSLRTEASTGLRLRGPRYDRSCQAYSRNRGIFFANAVTLAGHCPASAYRATVIEALESVGAASEDHPTAVETVLQASCAFVGVWA